MMNRFLTIVKYLVVFIAIQVFATFAVGFVWQLVEGDNARTALQTAVSDEVTTNGLAMLLISAVSSGSPFSRDYIRTRPWALLFWVAILACGTIIPSQWMLELLGLEAPPEMQQMFEKIMRQPAGYFVIGILVPIAEEMVFRGAILRTLLRIFNPRYHWLPIVLSALLFGAVHANMAQFFHATLLGLLLGWLYYHTNSIVPGIVLHWMNNTIAYVLTMLFPQSADCTLVELFGSEQRVWLALACSLCIFLPALFQIVSRFERRF